MAYIKIEKAIVEIDKGDLLVGNNAEWAKEILYRTPTADVAEVKHGEWVTLEAEIGLCACSLCDHKILRAECNYCPNCGAKMDGGVKDG